MMVYNRERRGEKKGLACYYFRDVQFTFMGKAVASPVIPFPTPIPPKKIKIKVPKHKPKHFRDPREQETRACESSLHLSAKSDRFGLALQRSKLLLSELGQGDNPKLSEVWITTK